MATVASLPPPTATGGFVVTVIFSVKTVDDDEAEKTKTKLSNSIRTKKNLLF